MKIPVVFCLALGLPLPAFAVLEQKAPPTPPADAANPLLVWDIDPALRGGLPRNFRTSSGPLKAGSGPIPDRTGLAALHESGSSEFTPQGFRLMLARMSGPVTVFDLRQESHIFVNGEPVSWYASKNWANAGRTHDAIVADERARALALAPGTELALGNSDAKKGGTDAGVENITVARTATEEQVVTAAGASYVRITVSDHSRPSDEEVDRFILAVRQMPADGWAHFHCRAGEGRTTTFMALYDMLRNAGRVPLPDIVDRQSLLIGDYNLLAKGKDRGWKAAVFEDRAAFVRAFYDYAKNNPGGRPQLWSEWLKAQP